MHDRLNFLFQHTTAVDTVSAPLYLITFNAWNPNFPQEDYLCLQIIGQMRRHYCLHEVPPGWLEGAHTRNLVHSNQPVESKRVTWQPGDYTCPNKIIYYQNVSYLLRLLTHVRFFRKQGLILSEGF